MPDWSREIRERLAGLKVDPAREPSIVEEISQHLDDRYSELLARGEAPDSAPATAPPTSPSCCLRVPFIRWCSSSPRRQRLEPAAVTSPHLTVYSRSYATSLAPA